MMKKERERWREDGKGEREGEEKKERIERK